VPSRSAVAELVGALVAIDSVNPDLVSGGAGEAEIASFVAGWLRDAGLDVTLDEPAPGRVSVVGAVPSGRGSGRSLMLNAHLDTVGVEGMQRPHEPEVRDGRLYGRGAYDMKGSLAAIMLAAARYAREPGRGTLIVTAVADEEYASIGTQAVLREHTADAAIVTEPTALRVCVAHKGFAWLDIETRGRTAHGSRPDEGEDAIVKMGTVLTGLAELDE
jgi:acetylornithine deacetylase